jgi:hypothetical protein
MTQGPRERDHLVAPQDEGTERQQVDKTLDHSALAIDGMAGAGRSARRSAKVSLPLAPRSRE